MAVHTDDARSVDAGLVAVTGHKMLDSISVVAAAVETLHREDAAISAGNRGRLEDALARHIALLTDAARALMRGDTELLIL